MSRRRAAAPASRSAARTGTAAARGDDVRARRDAGGHETSVVDGGARRHHRERVADDDLREGWSTCAAVARRPSGSTTVPCDPRRRHHLKREVDPRSFLARAQTDRPRLPRGRRCPDSRRASSRRSGPWPAERRLRRMPGPRGRLGRSAAPTEPQPGRDRPQVSAASRGRRPRRCSHRAAVRNTR